MLIRIRERPLTGVWLHAAGSNSHGVQNQQYQSSIMAYEAASQGLGMAIAQRVLVASDLKSSRLIAPFAQAVQMDPFTYYLVYPENRLRNPAFRIFKDWLIKETLPEITQAVKAA
jgi:LysR family glycine cleavage system transcriptional activator